MSKIKVTHLIDHLGAGGAQEIIRDLLYNLDKNKFEQEIICCFNRDKYGEEFEKNGFRVHYLNLGEYNELNIALKILSPLTYWKLRKIFRNSQTDIINIHLYFSLIAGSIFNTLFHRSKTVYTMHAMKNQLESFFYLFKIFSFFIDTIVADIEEIKTEFKTLGIRESKIVTINFATNFFDLPKNNNNSIRKEFSISHDSPVILNIARLHKHKGQVYLIKAFKKVLEKSPKAKLIIVGNGEEEDNIKQLIKSLNLEKSVILPGFRRDILDILDASDIFVLPSINEGLGMVTLQAMSRKKPIIAFQTGALDRLIINNETGFLVPAKNIGELAEKIVKLIDDPELKLRIGENCFKVIRDNFNLKTFAQKYEHEYKKLTEK